MRTKVLIGLVVALLIGCWVASGQLVIIGQPTGPLASAASFPLPSGIKHRWKASDLSSSPVSTWTDSVSGFNMTQTTGTQQPTWNATGVIFDGVNDLLVVTNVTGPVGGAVLVVMNLNSVAAVKQILCNNATGGNIFLGFNSAGCFYEGGVGDAICGITTGHTFDFLSTTFGSAPTGRNYTNGVSAYDIAGAQWNSGVTISKLGASSALGANPMNGTIKEIIIWTNTTFTSADVAAIHAYATNTYSFSP